MYTFSQLQAEVARRGTRNQSGSAYTTAIKNIINTSISRVSREAYWKSMRRKTYFTTTANYTTGTGAVTVTNNSKNVSVVGATFLTNNIQVGQRVNIGGSTKSYIIRTITSETTFTVDKVYDGTTSSAQSYTILGAEEYNIPLQFDHRAFVWHEAYGFPFQMYFVTDQDFYQSGAYINTSNIPTNYKMWGMDTVVEQLLQPSVLRVYSSSSADTNIAITVFGTVSGYPDYEVITTNASDGTTVVTGSKSFSSVDRVTKNGSTTGRITVDANTANTTVSVLPVGDTSASYQYSKIQLWPLPQTAFDVNVWGYKKPYRLVNDGDIHDLGDDFDEAIILLAVSKIKAEENQAEAKGFFSLYADELASLKKNNSDKLDWIPGLKKAKDSRKNLMLNNTISYYQLGGQFGPSVR